MKAWSLESAFVSAYSAAAVAVQGVLDTFGTLERITRPPRQQWADLDTPLDYDDDTPNPNEPGLTDDELIGVRGLLQERYHPTDVSSAGDSAGEVSDIPPSPSPAHPDDAGAEWVGWAVPAICEVLAGHQLMKRAYDGDNHDGFSCIDSLTYRPHGHFDDYQAWSEHVAPLIAVHLENALAQEFPTK